MLTDPRKQGERSHRWPQILLGGGHLIYLHQGTLFGVPFDLNRLEVWAALIPLLENVAGTPNNGDGHFDFSLNGTFVYVSATAVGEQTVAWLDTAGKLQPLLGEPAGYLDLRFSPDGKRLAFFSGGDIQVYDCGREPRDTVSRNGRRTLI